jgi:hypothetical protein
MVAENLLLALALIALGFVVYRRKEPASVEAPVAVAVIPEAPVDDQEDEAKLSARRAQSQGLEVRHADEVVHVLRRARAVEQALVRARGELDQAREEVDASDAWWWQAYSRMEPSSRGHLTAGLQQAASDWLKYQGLRIEQLEAALAARGALEQALPARRSPMEADLVSTSERARVEARFVARDAEAELARTLLHAISEADSFARFAASSRSLVEHYRTEAAKQGRWKSFETWRADERERARETRQAIDERDRRWREEKRRSRRARNACTAGQELS